MSFEELVCQENDGKDQSKKNTASYSSKHIQSLLLKKIFKCFFRNWVQRMARILLYVFTCLPNKYGCHEVAIWDYKKEISQFEPYQQKSVGAISTKYKQFTCHQ